MTIASPSPTLNLSWKDKWVPHALLDINRGCNISCRACYNSATAHAKPLEQIQREIRSLLALRRLDSLGIVGGEPTLHPQLIAIIHFIKSHGLNVELFTNGLLLTPEFLRNLKSAGTDLIFLHIDPHQRRPDLPDLQRLSALRAAKCAAVANEGMEVGLAVTAYSDSLPQIDAAVDFALASPHANYLLVTLCRQTQEMGPLRGNLSAGICAQSSPTPSAESLTGPFVLAHMRTHFNMHPFASIGSNVNPKDLRWFSYFIAACPTGARAVLRPSAAERLFLELHRRIRGRYPFFIRQSPGKLRVQLLLNAFSGGHLKSNLSFLARTLGKPLAAKRLLFQCPAEVAHDGSLIHCAHCPDATLVDGSLVPVCVCDQMVSPCAT